MYEDKTLKCKDCGADFVFTAGEQEFYARLAVTLRRTAELSVKCSQLYAQAAAVRLRFPSSPVMTDPFTAASASLRETSTKFIGNTNRFGF